MDSKKGYIVRIAVKEATIFATVGDAVEVYFKVRCTAGKSNRSEPGKISRHSFSNTKVKWSDEVKLLLPEDSNLNNVKIMIQLYKSEKGSKPHAIAETRGFLISEGTRTHRFIDGGDVQVQTAIVAGTVRQKSKLSIQDSKYSAVFQPEHVQVIIYMMIKIVGIFCWVDVVNSAVAFTIVAILSYCPARTADCFIASALLVNLFFVAFGFGSKPSIRKLQKSHPSNGLVSRLVLLLEISYGRHCKEVEFHLIILLGNLLLGVTHFLSGKSQHTVTGVSLILLLLGAILFLDMPLSCVILLASFVLFPLAFEWALLKERCPFLPSMMDLTPELLQGPIKFYNYNDLEPSSPPSLLSPPSRSDRKGSDRRSPSTKFLTPESEGRKTVAQLVLPSLPQLPNLLKESKDLRDDSKELNLSTPSDDSVRNCPTPDCRDDHVTDRPIYCAVVCPIEKKLSEQIYKEVRDIQDKKLQGQRNGKAPKHDVVSAACTLLLTLLNQSVSAYRCFVIPDDVKKRLQENGSLHLDPDSSCLTAALLPLNRERDLSYPIRSQMGKCTRGYTFEKELEQAVECCRVLHRCAHPRTETSLLRERLIALSYVASELLSPRVTVTCRMADNLVFVTRVSSDAEKLESSSRLSFPDDYVPYFREDIVPKPLLRAFLRVANNRCGGRGKSEPSSKCCEFMKMQIANAKFRYHKTSEMMIFRDTCGSFPETSAPDESPATRRKESQKKFPLPKKSRRERFSFISKYV